MPAFHRAVKELGIVPISVKLFVTMHMTYSLKTEWFAVAVPFSLEGRRLG
jgi:hypothetical protein